MGRSPWAHPPRCVTGGESAPLTGGGEAGAWLQQSAGGFSVGYVGTAQPLRKPVGFSNVNPSPPPTWRGGSSAFTSGNQSRASRGLGRGRPVPSGPDGSRPHIPAASKTRGGFAPQGAARRRTRESCGRPAGRGQKRGAGRRRPGPGDGGQVPAAEGLERATLPRGEGRGHSRAGAAALVGSRGPA